MGFVLFPIVLLPLRAKYIRAHTRLADSWAVLRRRSEAPPTDLSRYLHRLPPSLVSYAIYMKKQFQQGHFESLEQFIPLGKSNTEKFSKNKNIKIGYKKCRILTENLKTSKKALARNSFSLGTLCSRKRAGHIAISKARHDIAPVLQAFWEGGVAPFTITQEPPQNSINRNNRQHFSSSSCSISRFFRLFFLQYTSKCCKNNCGIFGSAPTTLVTH